MKHEIVIIDTGLDRMTGPRDQRCSRDHAATMAGEEEGSWVTQSLARLMRTRLWADPIEREGTYILRARPLGEVLSSCSEKVSRETVPRVEPAGECQHGDLLNSRGSQRCNRRQRGSATHPGVVNDRNVRCIWAVNDLECAAMYSAVGCRPWRWTQTHQRHAFQEYAMAELLKLAQRIRLVMAAAGDNCDGFAGCSHQSSRTGEME